MSLLPEENGNIVTHPGSESEILKLLSDSYLYKDILDWEHIKKADKIVKLLQALAFQIVLTWTSPSKWCERHANVPLMKI